MQMISKQIDQLAASYAIWPSEYSCLADGLLLVAARGSQPLSVQLQVRALLVTV